MKKYSLPVLLFALTMFMVSACDLHTEPRQSVSPGVALGTIDGISATLNSVYYRMQRPARYGRHLLLAPDVLADNADMHPQTSGRYSGQSINNPGSHIDSGLWGNAYRSINEANLVIEALDEVEGDQSQKDMLRGEALFHRAFAHFDLARVYGYEPGQEVDGFDLAVPIRVNATRDVADADFRPRDTNRAVYDQVIADLEQAISLLEGNDRGVYYINAAAAHALLARVHLYQGNWNGAITHAEEALARASGSLVDAGTFSGNVFEQHPNPESIFELEYDPALESVGTNEAPVAILTPHTWFDVLPSQELRDLYQENDARNALFQQHTDDFWMILKYTNSKGSAADNHPVIRVPEMYLILAEAHLELDDEATALEYLHTLQETRGMDPADVSGYQAVIEEIMDERRRELAFEGHRFFDLKRKGWDIPKPASLGGTPIPYTDYRILAELPSSQVDNNPEMEQNPGY